VSISDSSGVAASGQNVQSAVMVLAADEELRAGTLARVTPLSWRSARCLRVVNSTLAGEAQAASTGLAEAEWVQVLIRNMVSGKLPSGDWTRTTGHFTTVIRDASELAGLLERVPHQHVTDAKSLYDALCKDAAGGRIDRRSTIDIAIIRNSMHANGSIIRWLPPHARGLYDQSRYYQE